MRECPGCYSTKLNLDTREVSELPKALQGGATIQRLTMTGYVCCSCGDFWARHMTLPHPDRKRRE